jgi:hypothetical protein
MAGSRGLEIRIHADLAQDRVGPRPVHAHDSFAGSLDGGSLFGRRQKHAELEAEQVDGGGRDRFLYDRRPMIDDCVGDRRILTLGNPGQRRPRIRPGRADRAGGADAL